MSQEKIIAAFKKLNFKEEQEWAAIAAELVKLENQQRILGELEFAAQKFAEYSMLKPINRIEIPNQAKLDVCISTLEIVKELVPENCTKFHNIMKAQITELTSISKLGKKSTLQKNILAAHADHESQMRASEIAPSVTPQAATLQPLVTQYPANRYHDDPPRSPVQPMELVCRGALVLGVMGFLLTLVAATGNVPFYNQTAAKYVLGSLTIAVGFGFVCGMIADDRQQRNSINL